MAVFFPLAWCGKLSHPKKKERKKDRKKVQEAGIVRRHPHLKIKLKKNNGKNVQKKWRLFFSLAWCGKLFHPESREMEFISVKILGTAVSFGITFLISTY